MSLWDDSCWLDTPTRKDGTVRKKEDKMKFKEEVDPNLRYLVLVMYTLIFGIISLVLFVALLGLFSFHFKIDDFEVNFTGWAGRMCDS